MGKNEHQFGKEMGTKVMEVSKWQVQYIVITSKILMLLRASSYTCEIKGENSKKWYVCSYIMLLCALHSKGFLET